MSELIEAIEAHDTKRVFTLLRNGCDPNAADPDDPHWVPLKFAVDELEVGGSIDVVAALLAHGASVHSPPTVATALLIAVTQEHMEAVRILLGAGSDPNAGDDEGSMPLLTAVENQDLAMASLLLASGAYRSIDRGGGLTGCTPLGLATYRLDVPMVELLLGFGASPDATDANRLLAIDALPRSTPQNRATRTKILELLTNAGDALGDKEAGTRN